MRLPEHKPSWLSLIFVITFSACDASRDKHSSQFHKRNELTFDSFAAHKISPNLHSVNVFSNLTEEKHDGCNIDRNSFPDLSNLVQCRNNSLFTIWRPKARMMGSRGWLNDPMAIYQTKNGTWHVGYQCQPNNYVWGNVSQCSASTNDFTYFNDYHSWEDPTTIAPSALYDIRGVFDGSIIKEGWNGHPTLIYTSTFPGTLGWQSQPPEKEGTETQSIAFTEDDGHTWTKLNFGQNGNPIIYNWPEKHLTGFRDPYIFESEEFLQYYSNSSIQHQVPNNGVTPTGTKFLTISGGIRADFEPSNAGPRLFLYRQTKDESVLDWTYLGPLVSLPPIFSPVSPWQGGSGVNFECGTLSSIDEKGRKTSKNESDDEELHHLNMFIVGTEGARNGSHHDYWPIWHALRYDYDSADGNVKAHVEFSGVVDWGTSYAYSQFAGADNRQLLVGWCYEDDEYNILTYQRGYQGAFTLFRDIFVKVIRGILPTAPELNEKDPSWKVVTEKDGSKSIVTLGQKIIPEIIDGYKKQSSITKLNDRTVDVGVVGDEKSRPMNLVGFESQPTDKYFAITAQLDFHGSSNNATNIDRSSMVRGGFRVLSSDREWTDIYYDPSTESMVVSRLNSSLIQAYGNDTEAGRLRLWPIQDPVTNLTSLESLNLTIVVDNSIVEVYANDQTVITTRVYPWLLDSNAVAFFVQAPDAFKKINLDDDQSLNHQNTTFIPQSVTFSNVELWDGLLNAWPNRPRDSSLPGIFSHNITSTIYGLWSDI